MSLSSNDTTSLIPIVTETNFSRQIKFISIGSVHIPSTTCSLFLLYHLIFNQTNRHALQNHAMIALLITGLITVAVDVPMILHFLHTGTSMCRSPAGCLIWNFIDLSLYALISLFMVWTSFERHILIFHKRLLNTQQQRRFVHYAPLIVLPVYVVIFYAIVIFLYPCQNVFDYNQVVCGELCYYSNTPLLGVIDQLFNNIVPSILTAFFNMTLLIRVRLQKNRVRKSMCWSQQRKMILQLFPVSILYLCGVIPFGLLACIDMFGGWRNVNVSLKLHFFYLFYYMTILLPFVCLIGMPCIYSKLSCKRHVQIVPA